MVGGWMGGVMSRSSEGQCLMRGADRGRPVYRGPRWVYGRGTVVLMEHDKGV